MGKTFLYRFDQLLTGRWIDLLLVALAALASGSTLLLLARGAIQLSPNAQTAIFFFGAMALCLVALVSTKYHVRSLGQWPYAAEWRQIAFVLLLGVFLRATWVTLLPATPSSDGATYILLASKLLDGMGYEMADTYAYWPPGYPLFLAVWLVALPTAIAVPLSQITLFVVGALGVYKLTRQVANESAAMISLLLFSIWPNLIALSSTPEKEVLILALIPWGMYWVLRGSIKALVLAGFALGASVLVQPSLQLMIPMLALMLVVRNGFKFIPSALLLVLSALLVIAPWTTRNYVVLGEFKLVGTNGGDVLYRANNPLATGGYTERGEVDLSHLSELESDRRGRELAVRWILENPASFAALAFEKQVRFMGDDAVGIYSTFRADGEKRHDSLYVPLKLLANLWWLIIWVLLARFILSGNRLPKDLRYLMWGWFYLFALHSVFESAGKYHVPMIWVLCVALGALCSSRDEPVSVAIDN